MVVFQTKMQELELKTLCAQLSEVPDASMLEMANDSHFDSLVARILSGIFLVEDADKKLGRHFN